MKVPTFVGNGMDFRGFVALRLRQELRMRPADEIRVFVRLIRSLIVGYAHTPPRVGSAEEQDFIHQLESLLSEFMFESPSPWLSGVVTDN